MRAQKHVLLPQEDAAAFAAHEAALLDELAPEGALQTVLARRVAVAAWRLERADRLEAEVLEVRSHEGANAGVALIRDGNGTRSFETLMRYRSVAMAELMRALRTLKALQAEQSEEQAAGAEVRALPPRQPRAPARLAPNEPERRPEPAPERRLEYLLPATPAPDHALHEPAAPWVPHQPEADPRRVIDDIGAAVPNEPEATQIRRAQIAEALSFRRVAPEA